MGIRTEFVMVVSVLSLVISMIMQSAAFDNNRAISQGILNVAAAFIYTQTNGKTITGNNLEQPSPIVSQQPSSDTIQTPFKNIALPSVVSTTQSTNLCK